MTPVEKNDGNARRLRAVSWLLRTVAVGWIVLSVLILSLIARKAAPAHHPSEGVRTSILAMNPDLADQQACANKLGQNKRGVSNTSSSALSLLIVARAESL